MFRYALFDVGLLIAAGIAGYRSGDPGTGDSASIGTGLSYHYLPAVLKTLLEMTIRHRISMVNGNPALLPSEAIDALFKFGRGRPRLLNTLADNALFEAYLAGRTTIDASDIERSAADLGIGPDPGSTYSHLSMASPVPPIMEPLAPTEPSASSEPTPLGSQASPVSAGQSSIDAETGSMPELDLTPSMMSLSN